MSDTHARRLADLDSASARGYAESGSPVIRPAARESLDPRARAAVLTRIRHRLPDLHPADLRYRAAVVCAMGRRPGEREGS